MHIAICDDQQTAVDTLYRAIKNYFADKDLTLSSLTTYIEGICKYILKFIDTVLNIKTYA